MHSGKSVISSFSRSSTDQFVPPRTPPPPTPHPRAFETFYFWRSNSRPRPQFQKAVQMPHMMGKCPTPCLLLFGRRVWTVLKSNSLLPSHPRKGRVSNARGMPEEGGGGCWGYKLIGSPQLCAFGDQRFPPKIQNGDLVGKTKFYASSSYVWTPII